jgi:hypothetical protein
LPVVSTAKYGQTTDAAATAPAPRFAVYGENILTGNRWECVADIATYAEAQQVRNGWARLESDYKIVYTAEPQA